MKTAEPTRAIQERQGALEFRLLGFQQALRFSCGTSALVARNAGRFMVLAAWTLILVSPMVAQNADSNLSSSNRELRTLNHYFPFEPPRTLQAWKNRRSQLRRNLQIHLGLWPMPTKTPLNAVIHGKLDMGKYTVEKVYFESFPGFYVTGNLYRPKKSHGKCPAILSPHGHWSGGRFLWASDAEVKKQIDSKAEDFEGNARSPLQARCANLAMKGCVVFHYDMVGYADCTQISQAVAHGFRKSRPEMNKLSGYGFFSPIAESRLQSIMGLQTWNSIRSLDFLSSLPDVDSNRIAVTGASGGGTQTYILCAIDPRPVAAFPAVMVSTAMQGGCTCENCSHLRVRTGNVELAALFAPKPLGLTAANDWTKEMKTKGYPQLLKLYSLYDQPDRLSLHSRTDFGHNFNQRSREALYRFLKRHKVLPSDADLSEQELVCLKREKLTVFGPQHQPKRLRGKSIEMKLLRHWTEDYRKQLANDPLYVDEIYKHRKMMLPALRAIVMHPSESLTMSAIAKKNDSIYGEEFVGNRSKMRWAVESNGETLTSKLRREKMVEIVLGRQTKELKRHQVALVWNDDGKNRLVNNGRAAAGYTYGYNRPILAMRVSKLLNTIHQLQKINSTTQIALRADAESAMIAVVALGLLKDPIQRLDIDASKLGEAHQSSLTSPDFLPGLDRIGGASALLRSNPPRRLVLSNPSSELRKQIQSVYSRDPELDLNLQK